MSSKTLQKDLNEELEWLFDDCSGSKELGDDFLREIVAEVENQGFEPLQPFEDQKERHRFSPLKERGLNPALYQMLLGSSGLFAGQYASAAIQTGNLLVDMTVKVDVLGMMAGACAGLYAGGKIGKRAGEWVNERYSRDRDFSKRVLEGGFQPELYDFISESDFIAGVESPDDDLLVSHEAPLGPEGAAEAYKSAMEQLEEVRDYWEDEIFLENYERLSDQERAIIESKDIEQLKETELGSSVESMLEELEAKERLDARNREGLKKSEISAFLKYNTFETEFEGQDTGKFVYDGTAYEIEIYQGEELVLTIDGVNSGTEPGEIF